ncbi:MAG TPA: S8 family peptidase [Solirubrobacterales bacterium]|nr:S8 family peptidase [Solirubrobacterales bacterium]
MEATAFSSELRVVEGVDPGLVYKIRAAHGIDEEKFTSRDLTFLGETGDFTYFVYSGEEPDKLISQLHRYGRGPDEMGGKGDGRTFFNVLEGIEPYGPEDRKGRGIPEDLGDLEEPAVVDVIAWPSHDRAEAERRLQQIRAVVESLGGDELASDARRQFTVLRGRLPRKTIEGLLALSAVERLTTPPVPFLEPSDWMQRSLDDIAFEGDADGEAIGVLDDGVASGHPLLDGLVASERSFPAEHEWQPIGAHGTLVAGLAAYGDFEVPLRDGHLLEGRGPIHCARVLEPDPGPTTATRFPPGSLVHRVIEEAIRTLHGEDGVRVFNLSIGSEYAYSGPHVALPTESLDFLIRELGIVVVVAAGNHPVHPAVMSMDSGGHVLTDYPSYTLHELARVCEPGPAALALTVGSIARSDAPQTPDGTARVGDRAVAKAEEISPFSRTGPGAYKGVKPDLVEYGGNWVVNDTGNLDYANSGVASVSLGDGGGRLFGLAAGTSFAAPRVSRLAADIWGRYPDASPNLVRALIGIASRVPRAVEAQFPGDEERLRAVGYGRPVPELALDSGVNRVVMYFDGEMDANTVAVHPVPIPDSFARGRSQRRISVALAFDPPVRRQRREYLAGEMSFDFLRNVEPDEIAARYARQGADRVDLWTDRHRLKLKPGSTRTARSTLQVRRIFPRELRVDDGDTYYLAVKHKPAPWTSGGTQRYAVVVEIVDEERQQLDIYAEAKQQIQVRPRIRV